jgi:putative transcriptional regulator
MSERDLPLILEEDDGEALAAAALALPPVPPPPELRARLLASATASPGARFHRFVPRLAAILDLGLGTMTALVDAIDDATRWVAGPGGLDLFHLEPGPAVTAENVGFVRLRSGETFPRHRHDGSERVVCLQGSFVETSGAVRGPGDEVVMEDGSEHGFTVLPGPALVFLAVLERGITFADGSRPEI